MKTAFLPRAPYFFLTCTLFMLLFQALSCFAPAALAAQQAVHPGYRSLVTWQPEKNLRLDVSVWYPTARQPKLLDKGSWKFMAAQNAPALGTGYPVLLLSHASSGSRYAHHDLASSLAVLGYVVVCPTHVGDNSADMRLTFNPYVLDQRARQLIASLDLLLEDSFFKGIVDPQRVAALGFGNGAATALILAGATLTAEQWSAYCTPENPDPYCTPFLRQKIDDMIAQKAREKNARIENAEKAEAAYAVALKEYNSALAKAKKEEERLRKAAQRKGKSPEPVVMPVPPVPPVPLAENPNFYDARVKAVAAISPAFSPLFNPSSLERISVPVLIIAAGKDTLNLPSVQNQNLRAHIPQALYSLLPEADLPALQSPCPPDILDLLPDLCFSVTPQQRSSLHSQLTLELSRFFQKFL